MGINLNTKKLTGHADITLLGKALNLSEKKNIYSVWILRWQQVRGKTIMIICKLIITG